METPTPPIPGSPRATTGRPPHLRAAVAALSALLLLAGAWAAWWLVGPRAAVGDCDDRIVDAPTWSPLADRPWTIVAVLVAAGALVGLTRLGRSCGDRAVVLGAIGLLSTAAVIVGGGGRVVTAPTCGANIGGGLVIMFGTPLAVVLVLLAAWGLRRAR